MRNTLHAQEELEAMRINETEEYLGLLRARMAMTQTQVAEADEQIGMVREVLNSDGIPEVSLSDDEDSASESCLPSPSEMVLPESSVTDMESECGLNVVNTSLNEHINGKPSRPSSLGARLPPMKKQKVKQG